MNFNLFKKKKDDEIKVGGMTLKTSQPTPAPRPAPQRQQVQKSQFTPTLTDRFMKGQNLVTGQDKQQPKTLTWGVDAMTGKNMQQRLDNTSQRAKEQTPDKFYGYKAPEKRPPVNYQIDQQQISDPMGKYRELGQEKQSLLDRQKGQMTDYYNQAYGERNRLLGEYIPTLQKQFAQAQGGIRERQDLAGQEAETLKDQTVDQWGTGQRQAAQERREGEARVAGRFADLNTSDSYGYGSHQESQANLESDFNRFTQEMIKERENNLSQIDRALQESNLQAKELIDGMEVDLNNAIMQIQSDMRMNDIEKENAINQVVNEYQSGVTGIQEWLHGIETQYQQHRETLESQSLSPEFMATGVPQNENDYQFYISNFDKYQEMTGGGAETQNLIGLVDEALQSDLGAVSGFWGRSGLTRISGGGLETQALIDQIKNSLTVEAREKLKGSGAISDAETEMLANSVSKLHYGMSQDALKRELAQIKNILQGQDRYAGGEQRPSLESLIQ